MHLDKYMNENFCTSLRYTGDLGKPLQVERSGSCAHSVRYWFGSSVLVCTGGGASDISKAVMAKVEGLQVIANYEYMGTIDDLFGDVISGDSMYVFKTPFLDIEAESVIDDEDLEGYDLSNSFNDIMKRYIRADGVMPTERNYLLDACMMFADKAGIDIPKFLKDLDIIRKAVPHYYVNMDVHMFNLGNDRSGNMRIFDPFVIT